MYKVFVNNNVLLLRGRATKETRGVLYPFSGKELLTEVLEKMEKDVLQAATIEATDEEALWTSFRSLFHYVEAAGGLVKNTAGHLLGIYRLGKWDLPKGKMEKNESPEEAAIREVEEECGISQLRIHQALPNMYHTYTLRGKRVLKCTYWFEMCYAGKELLKPQLEEGITEVAWLDEKGVERAMDHTYASIRELLQEQKDLPNPCSE